MEPGLSPQQDREHWEDWLGRLLWDVSSRINALGEDALADSPLSLSSLGVLDWIADHPGITIAEIARRSPTTQQAVSQVTARLEKLGFVERRLTGGRGIGLFVTASGTAARDRANVLRRRLEQRLRKELGAARHQELLRLLGETRTLVMDLEGRGDRA